MLTCPCCGAFHRAPRRRLRRIERLLVQLTAALTQAHASGDAAQLLALTAKLRAGTQTVSDAVAAANLPTP